MRRVNIVNWSSIMRNGLGALAGVGMRRFNIGNW